MHFGVQAAVLSGFYVAICSLMPGESVSNIQFWAGFAFCFLVAWVCRTKSVKPDGKATIFRKLIPSACLALPVYGLYLWFVAPEKVENGAFEAVTETSDKAYIFGSICMLMCLIFMIVLKVMNSRRGR